jgi:FlaG/FlaF family flagellin (archaellin)
MRPIQAAFTVLALVSLAACGSGGSASAGESSPPKGVGDSEINRYVMTFTGDLSLDHTGGLICKVEDGALEMSFAIDASDGAYTYEATFPGFDPTGSSFTGTFTLNATAGGESSGTATVSFAYGPAPAEYPGVVRAAGSISGSIGGSAGAASISGAYACFLMNKAVGQ